MSLLEIILIAVGLAMDAFAVSVGAGTLASMKDFRSTVRLAFHFGLFQFLMPVAGWFLGSTLQVYVESIDHWIAFSLLAYIGIKMIHESFKKEESQKENPSKGKNLIILSVATSIDALVVGFTLAMLDVNIWYPSIMIGLITAGLSFLGIWIGKKLGMKLGRVMEVVGGLILIGIGAKILVEHLFGL
ncbi:MAG: manganese efflux pump MntP family protein [Ignavibacteriota bacterium]|nr:manganese efflux pump MntP family protein [Ignavibacteriota bacterium]